MRWIGYLLHATLLVALAAAYTAPFVDPRMFWPPAMLGLVFPWLWLANVAALCFWLFWRRWRAAVLTGLILLPAIGPLPRYWGGGGPSAEGQTVTRNTLRVLSWNVRIFNKNTAGAPFSGRGDMMDLLHAEAPDVLCLQEYFTVPGAGAENHDRLVKASTGLRHESLWKAIVDRRGRTWGLAIFSRYPILDQGVVAFPESVLNGCQWADLDLPGGRTRIFNVHLQSIKLSHEVYAMGEAVNDMRAPERRRDLLRKFRDAYFMRAKQAALVSEAVAASPYPVILCGDFNDPPQSFAYRRTRASLQDAFAEAGHGLARSHATLPGVRIDYILPDTSWNVMSYSTVKSRLSDHFPVSAGLAR